MSTNEWKLRNVSIWFAVLLVSVTIEVDCFVPLPVAQRYTTNRFGQGDGNDLNSSRRGESDEDDQSFDVENARQRLENLLSSPGKALEENADEDSMVATTSQFSFSGLLSDYSNGLEFSSASLPPPPPLSAIERNRRLVEIRLLECLLEGDDAITLLWDHWYSERGSNTKLRLEEAGEMFLDRIQWKACERNLIELVDEFGIYFVEPVNLLATLYYIQGKHELSYKLCETILSIKPYHVGALSGIVQVAANLGDAKAVHYWASKRLPSSASKEDIAEGEAVPENPRRAEWVEKAVAAAKEHLDQAEQRTQEDFFGKPETYYESAPVPDGNRLNNENDEDAWQ